MCGWGGAKYTYTYMRIYVIHICLYMLCNCVVETELLWLHFPFVMKCLYMHPFYTLCHKQMAHGEVDLVHENKEYRQFLLFTGPLYY